MPHASERDAAEAANGRRIARQQLLLLSPEARHLKLLAERSRFYGGAAAAGAHSEQPVRTRTDSDALKDGHRFLRTASDDDGSWEARLAAKYYSRLFREYARADLSRADAQKLGLRWRTEKEVLSGAGQLSCGALRCDATAGLATFEVPFSYSESGEAKAALVKLRLCETCAQLLHIARGSDGKAAEGGERRGKRDMKRRRREREEGEAQPAPTKRSIQEEEDEEDDAALLRSLFM